VAVAVILILGSHKYNYRITVYVRLCLKACYMFHYSHFEANHLQYNKLSGAKESKHKTTCVLRHKGEGSNSRGEGGDDDDQAHDRCWLVHVQLVEAKSFLTGPQVAGTPGEGFPWNGRLGKEFERVCIWLT